MLPPVTMAMFGRLNISRDQIDRPMAYPRHGREMSGKVSYLISFSSEKNSF